MKSLRTLSAHTGAPRAFYRTIQRPSSSTLRPLSILTARSIQLTQARSSVRTFSSMSPFRLVLSPDSSDPKPPSIEKSDAELQSQSPADITDAEYHEIADQYINSLVLTLEELEGKDEGFEAEYSAGVMTVLHPSKGTYVLNKQPPNKQIWLSSPVSGPKRYDWVLKASGGMDSKQDTEGAEGDVGDNGHVGGGKWTYLRDGSTLTELLKDELNVTIAHGGESDVTGGREGPGGGGLGGIGVEG